MSEERNGGGGGRGLTSFTTSTGLITYKRRKRGLADVGSDLWGDPSVCSGGQVTEGLHDTVTCSSVHEAGGLSRTRHWKTVLDQLLQSQDVSDDGIGSCIQKALVSSHFSFTNKSSVNAALAKYAYEDNGNFCDETKRVNSFLNAAVKHNTTSTELQRDTSDQADGCAISKKCQSALFEVLVSEKFALLCDLLLGNFPGIKVDSIIDLSLINSKMKNRAYGPSIGLLYKDLQQVWNRIRDIGQEMVLLATCLSNISQASSERQRGEELGLGIFEQEYQKPCGADTEEKNSMDSHATMQIPCESDRSTKPEQTEASCLYKVSSCKECGAEADGECSLICDGCEVMYHFSCVKPAVHGIPSQNWYCSGCTRDKRGLTEPKITNTHEDGPHNNCAACDRLKVKGMISGKNATTNESRESSISSMDSEGSPQPSMTAMSKLCKFCGIREDDDKRFIVCDHSLCPYKYYHIRCLHSKQIAIQQQRRQGSWYCPSCICRSCLIDKDDDLIVMCDGCDEAYHTYCMKPPRTSVPKGKWYCVPCNISRAKEGMKKYEQWVLQLHKKSDEDLSNGLNKPMDLLASAAERVESLAAVKKNR
uniref:Methyl-CpG-binding domain-containing protein 9 n=1 Tax=Anthurium amnicola TaxID=1678845 RepID=A0A1D1XDT1_9ARAE